MLRQITRRVQSRKWTEDTARRFRILCRNWILERGPIMAALTVTYPVVYAQNPYQPKGWVWYDVQDSDGKWHLGSRDKRGHFICGMIAGSWGALLAEHYGLKKPWLWGLITGIAAGYLKELYDLKRGSGTAEYADWLWTSAGGATGCVIVRIRW